MGDKLLGPFETRRYLLIVYSPALPQPRYITPFVCSTRLIFFWGVPSCIWRKEKKKKKGKVERFTQAPLSKNSHLNVRLKRSAATHLVPFRPSAFLSGDNTQHIGTGDEINFCVYPSLFFFPLPLAQVSTSSSNGRTPRFGFCNLGGRAWPRNNKIQDTRILDQSLTCEHKPLFFFFQQLSAIFFSPLPRHIGMYLLFFFTFPSPLLFQSPVASCPFPSLLIVLKVIITRCVNTANIHPCLKSLLPTIYSCLWLAVQFILFFCSVGHYVRKRGKPSKQHES